MDNIDKFKEKFKSVFKMNKSFKRQPTKREDQFYPDLDEVQGNQPQNKEGPNSAQLSIEYKMKGNECLLSDKVDEAIQWYTKALVSIFNSFI